MSAAAKVSPVKVEVVTLESVLRGLYSGKRVRLERRHGTQHLCPKCQDDLMRVAIVDLVYVYDVCSCDFVSYDHLVEQLWHQSCFVTAGVPNAAARA